MNDSDVVVAKDHWSSKTYEFVLSHLGRGRERVDIATGYFTVQGYDLLRPALGGKAVRILVGYDEASKERLLDALIDNLLSDIKIRTGRTNCGKLITEVTIERVEPVWQLNPCLTLAIQHHHPIVYVFHIRAFNRGVTKVFIRGVQGMINLK